jgi:putative tricarboxylic transport membrane protein
MRRPLFVSGAVGLGVGLVPAAGGDIAGMIGWDRAKAVSKHPEKFGKGSIEGITASDTASSATLGGSLTTTMALGVPGDSVMAVMIGSMMIWGISPGPGLFTSRPDLVVSIAAIMLIATLLSLGVSLVRMRGMVKLLDVPNHYLWATILMFCIIGTYATTNNLATVVMMLAFGVVGLILKRTGFPAGPVVLGMLLGPLAEKELGRALLIAQGDFLAVIGRPLTAGLLVLALISLSVPIVQRMRAQRRATRSATEEPLTRVGR